MVRMRSRSCQGRKYAPPWRRRTLMRADAGRQVVNLPQIRASVEEANTPQTHQPDEAECRCRKYAPPWRRRTPGVSPCPLHRMTTPQIRASVEEANTLRDLRRARIGFGGRKYAPPWRRRTHRNRTTAAAHPTPAANTRLRGGGEHRSAILPTLTCRNTARCERHVRTPPTSTTV